MNFDAIKSGFMRYLEDKMQKEGKAFDSSQDASLTILNYTSEFREYIQKEYGNSPSIFSQGVDSLKNADFQDGEFKYDINSPNLIADIINDSIKQDSVKQALDKDGSGDLSKEEAEEFLNSITKDNNISLDDVAGAVNNILSSNDNTEQNGRDVDTPPQDETTTVKPKYNEDVDKLLNKAYDNKTVIEALDVDGDGKLSEEEKAKFENFLKDKNGNLTEDAIREAIGQIIEGDFSYDGAAKPEDTKTEEDEKTEEDKKAEETKTEDKETKTHGGTHSSGGTDSGGNTDYSGDKSDTSTDVSKKDIQNMSLDELKTYKGEAQQQVDNIKSSITEKETALNTAKDDYNTAKEKNQKAVEDAQSEYDEAEEEYKNAINEDAYLNSEEGKQLKEDIEKNLEDIDNTETEQNDAMTALNDANDRKTQANDKVNECSNNVTAAQSAVTEAEGTVAGLEAALASYSNISDDDTEAKAQKAALEEKLKNAKEALTEKKNKLTEAQEALEDAKAELTAAEQAVEAAQTKYDEVTEKLNGLNAEKAELDAKVTANCTQATIDAMEKYNEKKVALDAAKETQRKETDSYQKAIDTAQEALNTEKSKLSEAQAEVDKVNSKINEKEAEDENRAPSSNKDFVDNFNAIDRIKDGVFAGKGELIASIADEYGIDPYLLSAIMVHETGYGTSKAVRNQNNPGGIMGSNGLKSYSSLEEGIRANAKLLKEKYINDGLDTIAKIQKRYCPVGASNDPKGLNKYWLSSVLDYYNRFSHRNITVDTVIT